MPTLRKVVDVEASDQECTDYARLLIGDSVKFRAGCIMRIRRSASAQLQAQMRVVSAGFDARDGTVGFVYLCREGALHKSWLPPAELEVVEHIPADWEPCEGASAAAGNAQEIIQAHADDRAAVQQLLDPVTGPLGRWVASGFATDVDRQDD